jgi:hypothetical protein
MNHVTDELELYSLGAMNPVDRARVAAHLVECPACREQARAIDEVVQELPETLPNREAPGRLRDRILSSARADLVAARAPARDTAWLSRLIRPALGLAAALWIAVGAAAIAGDYVTKSNEVAVLERERASLARIVEGIREGGRWWYMGGKDEWSGSGGTLIAPRVEGRPPFVVFHDLKPLDPKQLYTIWLVSADNTWVRGANFQPDGRDVQAVDINPAIAGFDRCAVTVEGSAWGRRAGPIVMESRIVPATP